MSLFGSIWNDLKYSMRTGHMVTKLVVANFAIWVFFKLIYLALWLTIGFRQEMMGQWYNTILEWFCLPASIVTLAWRPWSLLTHFFLHDSIWHLIHNIFGLMIFGSVVGDLMGNRRVLPIYLLGGLAGAIVFLASAQFLPLGGY
ncbi:MAG: rhomboid family intramembrane serine protease, partial [Saprospiraceae bacterium]